MSWTGFAAIFAVFFLTHSIPLRPRIKGVMVKRLGARGFGLAYSAVSLAMLALLIHAAGRAPYIELWPQLPWQRHAVHLGMLAVCLILALSLGRPNPLSFGGWRNSRFDPTHPGMVRFMRHPVLVALALWAGLHLLPNGDLAHVLLFGVLGGFALAGGRLIDKRKHRELGEDAWHKLRSRITDAPVLSGMPDASALILRIAWGVTAFAALLALHPIVIGVSAL
jgi:uncharacterized membrane protein